MLWCPYLKFVNHNDISHFTVIYGGTLLTLMPGGFSHYVQLAEQFAPGMGIMVALKATLLLPLTYHTLNGFRHLVSFF